MSKQTVAFYNRFSYLYPLVAVFLKPQKKLLFTEINNLPDGKLLEIGVGNGAHLSLYKKHSVTGIDTSSAMLAIARRNPCANAELIEMNGEALQFDDGVFNYVILSHVIAIVGHPERLLQEVYRVLTPQGRLLILNHFTPVNWLWSFDYAVKPLARALQFGPYSGCKILSQ